MPPADDGGDPLLSPKALSKQEFGRRLHHLMLSQSMNQSELARRAGLGRDNISCYVRGLKFPTPMNIRKLADVLGVTTEELLPNAMMHAIDAEHPAVEIKQAPGHPGISWLRINRRVRSSTAVKILTLIEADDSEEQ